MVVRASVDERAGEHGRRCGIRGKGGKEVLVALVDLHRRVRILELGVAGKRLRKEAALDGCWRERR